MNRSAVMLSVCFCAGLLGALVNSCFVWLAGLWGLTEMAGVNMAPGMTLTWLYPRLVWGGLWGLAYFFTVRTQRARRGWVRKGLWVSLLPTAFQLGIVFPYLTPHDWLGLKLGHATPLFVLVFNFVWGLFTGVFCRLICGRRS
ncbi:MAG: hypothetical protein JRE63_03970 [Deltaproteobacteria bacterium]|nr:hypothetical protein [Deltaproteobacteria bacterium]